MILCSWQIVGSHGLKIFTRPPGVSTRYSGYTGLRLGNPFAITNGFRECVIVSGAYVNDFITRGLNLSNVS